MHLWSALTRLSALVHRRRFEAEMDEEVQFHVQMQIEEHIRRGLSPAQARRAALRGFGGVEQVKEECRSVRGVAWLESLWQDLRFGARMLRKSPSFTFAAVLTLAIGIGATTTVFSVIQAVLLQPLPFHEPGRLVLIEAVNRLHPVRNQGLSVPDFRDVQTHVRCFSAVAAYSWVDIDVVTADRAERLQGLHVTQDYFSLLGVEPTLGRAFAADEERAKARVIILSAAQHRLRFDDDREALGKTLTVNSWIAYPGPGSSPYVVVGVIPRSVPFLPASTEFDAGRVGIDNQVDFWLPFPIDGKETRNKAGMLGVVARLRPGATIQEARRELELLSAQLADEYPETNRDWSLEPVPLHTSVVREVQPALVTLFAAIGVVLLIACTNVANLLLARNVAREPEFAVRVALGASPRRLGRQLLTECLIVAGLGAGAGILLALAATKLIPAVVPYDVPRLGRIRIDGAVLAFALGLTVLTTLLIGLLPTLLATRRTVNQSLKQQQKGQSTSRGTRRVLQSLIVAEVSVAFLLVVQAGLLLRSFANVCRVESGFDASNVVSMTLSLPEAKYNWRHNSVFCNQVLEQVRALPGVQSAGAIRGVPLRETRFEAPILVEGRPLLPLAQLPLAGLRVVSSGYFETLRIPLLAGRLFEPRDSVGEIGITRSVVISETLARRCWPGEEAVGKRLKIAGTADLPWSEVVGVAGDVKYASLESPATADMYYPEALFPQTYVTLLTRTTGPPQSFVKAIRQAVASVEPTALILDVQTMQQTVARSLAPRRFITWVLSAFSAVALLLALIGVHGVISYSISQSAKEIGIRVALGANRAHVIALFAERALRPCLIGMALGLAVSLIAVRALASQLYGVSPIDPVTLAIAALLIAAAAAVSGGLAARKALQVEPIVALRGD